MSTDRSTSHNTTPRTRTMRKPAPLSPSSRSSARPNDLTSRRSRNWETDDDDQDDQQLLEDRRRYSQRKSEQNKAAKRAPRPTATSRPSLSHSTTLLQASNPS